MRVTVGALLVQMVYAPASLATADRGVNLDSLQWKQRVLLLPATRESSDGAAWMADRNAVLDRHLILFREKKGDYIQWFPKPRSPTTLALSRRMRELATGRVTLIGKDGGIKQQWQTESCALPRAVFEFIDTMPMRQREMRRQKDHGAEPVGTKAKE